MDLIEGARKTECVSVLDRKTCLQELVYGDLFVHCSLNWIKDAIESIHTYDKHNSSSEFTEHVLRKFHHCTFPVKFVELPFLPKTISFHPSKFLMKFLAIHHKKGYLYSTLSK